MLGGGLIASRIGELSMGRASILLKTAGVDVELCPIKNHPDEAGLIGAVQLAPAWILAGHDAILAIDIGGTNIRAGIVELNADKRGDVDEADVWKRVHWRHRDDKPTRDEAIERIAAMLIKLIERAEKEKMKLAPFIGIGCPGLIDESGTILKGGQNLPGNWEGEGFHLPGGAARALAAHRRQRHRHPDAQRRRGPGAERGAEHEGRAALGRHDHRHRAGQCAIHQPGRTRARMEAPRLERKLVAILAADVEGYSRHMERDEVATLATLSSHRLIVDELIAAIAAGSPARPATACWRSSQASSTPSTARSRSRKSWPRPTPNRRPTSRCRSASASMSAT